MSVSSKETKPKKYVIYDGKGTIYNIEADDAKEKFIGNSHSIIFYEKGEVIAKFYNFSAVFVMKDLPKNPDETSVKSIPCNGTVN